MQWVCEQHSDGERKEIFVDTATNLSDCADGECHADAYDGVL